MIYCVTRPYYYYNYGNYGYSSNGYDRGYEDGLYTGSKDADRGQSYDPYRSHFYQDAGHGFLSLWGHRDSYSVAYRDGFLRGYNEGYEHYDNYYYDGAFHR